LLCNFFAYHCQVIIKRGNRHLFLILEIPIDTTLRKFRGVGYIRHGGTGIAFRIENRGGSLDDKLAGGF